MKKTSIRELYCFTMACHIFTLICGVAGSVTMLINYSMWINSVGKTAGIVCLIVVIGGFVVLVGCSGSVIVTLLKDLRSLKNNEYISIIGKVLRFKNNREPESGVQINNNPVVLILDTNDEITLIINDNIMVGEVYKFNYLKNSRIAEVVNKSNG